MNTKPRTVMTLIAVMLTFGLFPLENSTSAQSRSFIESRRNSAQSTSAQSPNSNCKKLKGIRVDVFDPAAGIAFGTVTIGGILN